MALPSDQQLIDGLLNAMQSIGHAASIEEQEAQVGRLLSLSESDIAEVHSGGRSKLSYRLAWARTYLKSLGLLKQADRGVWELTDLGKKYASVSELRSANPDTFADPFDESVGVEGLDVETIEPFEDYPIDSVLIRQETRTVFEVVRRIREDKFIMDPDFQRAFIWNVEKQSKLIESMLMRIPLPVFYLAEREDGKTVVVDGLQRLSTFRDFLDNKVALRGLNLAWQLNDKKFQDLPTKLQNRLEDTQLILYLIDPKAPEQAKLDIFERVNGGVPLTRQQMRNSIYRGKGTAWLAAEADATDFRRATAGSLDWRTMRDRECINRYSGFSILGVETYSRGDMDSFLAQALKRMNTSPDASLANLSEGFRRSMRNNFTIFGRHAFRKHYSEYSRRSVINVALFDVFSVLFTRISESKAVSERKALQDRFYGLMENPRFVDAISFSTNSTIKVQTRFEEARKAFASLFDHD